MKNFSEWVTIREADEAKFKLNVPKVLIIMRGIPGSGKSYTANQMLIKHGGNAEGHIFATDNQYIPETRWRRGRGETVSPEEELEEYRKNYKLITSMAAHTRNRNEFKTAVDQGVTPLILDNTNVKKEQAKSYAEYADKAGYEIKIQEPTSDWWKGHRDLLKDKELNADKLEKFANLLHSKQSHGVPIDVIKDMIGDWHHNLKVSDILERDPSPKNEWFDSGNIPFKFGPSKIQGSGVMVVGRINKGTVLGTTHRMCTDGKWEMQHPLGNYNHSKDYNAVIIKNPTCKMLKVIKDLKPGDEIVVDYQEQPDLEQPGFDWH
jgi:hypothetical protein